MKDNITVNLAIFAVGILLTVVCAFGYFANVWKLVKCDFASPYKAEVVRGVGVFVPPVGIVAGYLNLGN